MIGFINVIDRLSAWVGKAFAWCILIMTVGVGYEVIVRYLLRDPTSWSFDMTYMMYGALFMMAGAYTLSRDGHVRGDVVYRLWPPRVQAVVEFILYFIFFFPGILALIFAGWDYAMESWSYNNGRGEVSVMSPAGVPISQLKTLLPAAGVLLFIQGIGQVCRCIVCMKTGHWPQQVEDVEEMETMLQHATADEAQAKAALGLGPKPRGRAGDDKADGDKADGDKAGGDKSSDGEGTKP